MFYAQIQNQLKIRFDILRPYNLLKIVSDLFPKKRERCGSADALHAHM